MIQQCYICGVVYGEKEPFEDKTVTHGLCLICFEQELEKIKKIRNETKKKKMLENLMYGGKPIQTRRKIMADILGDYIDKAEYVEVFDIRESAVGNENITEMIRSNIKYGVETITKKGSVSHVRIPYWEVIIDKEIETIVPIADIIGEYEVFFKKDGSSYYGNFIGTGALLGENEIELHNVCIGSPTLRVFR